MTDREAMGARRLETNASNSQVSLQVRNVRTGEIEGSDVRYDMVVLATGYQRNPFAGVLKPLESLIEPPVVGENFNVDRNYRVRFLQGRIGRDVGLWLQGCCESTHGVCLKKRTLLGELPC